MDDDDGVHSGHSCQSTQTHLAFYFPLGKPSTVPIRDSKTMCVCGGGGGNEEWGESGKGAGLESTYSWLYQHYLSLTFNNFVFHNLDFFFFLFSLRKVTAKSHFQQALFSPAHIDLSSHSKIKAISLHKVLNHPN